MGHRDLRRRAPLALLTAIALTLAGCSAVSPRSAAASALPDGIPTPSEAAVVVGQDGGYDAGATLFAFSSALAPAAAMRAYRAQLAAAGFAPAGATGTWSLYRQGQTLLAVRTGESGPPTDLLVRVMTVSAGTTGSVPTAGGNGTGGSSSNAAGGTGTPGSTGRSGGGAANGGSNSGNAGGNDNRAPGAASPNPNSNAGGNGGGSSSTGSENGNAGGNDNRAPGAASPNPNSNAGGNSGASPNPVNGPGRTPVPQPDPPHGQPSAPPGQVKATMPAAAQTTSPNP